MKWYIGQEIVCIKTHTQGAVTAGKHYFIAGIYEAMCNCGPCLDVGIIGNDQPGQLVQCRTCDVPYKKHNSPEWRVSSKLFAPLEPLCEDLDRILKEINEEQLELV